MSAQEPPPGQWSKCVFAGNGPLILTQESIFSPGLSLGDVRAAYLRATFWELFPEWFPVWDFEGQVLKP